MNAVRSNAGFSIRSTAITGSPRARRVAVSGRSLFVTERKLTQAREGGDRDYLQGAHDIHEASLDLQQRVRGVYLDAAREDAAFRVVDCCAPDGSMETPERIFSKIEAALAPLLNAAADA